MRKKIIAILGVLMVLLLAVFVWNRADAHASAPNPKNVSVTVPMSLEVVFEHDGSTIVEDVGIQNDSLVPIQLVGIDVSEYNDWEVVSSDKQIALDTKNISFQFEGQDLMPGSNQMYYEVLEGSSRNFSVDVKRGAWTRDAEVEKALQLDFFYEIGRKNFTLTLEDGVHDKETIIAENFSNVTLPSRDRDDYEFVGWQDEDGKIHKDIYNMPVGDTTLNAVWNEKVAYAIFSETDKSLTFVKTANEIQPGDVYNGKTVTNVYTGFEDAVYTSYTEVPWYKNYYTNRINAVYVDSVIKPISTAYWFAYQEFCQYLDLTNLSMSRATDMQYMFYRTGRSLDKETDFTIRGMEDWDVSKVTNMQYAFTYSGIFAPDYNVGNIGKWDVSNVTNMRRMFQAVGMRATNIQIGDLSNWNTGKVTDMSGMFDTFAYFTPTWNVGNLGKWNVSNVTNMANMFTDCAVDSNTFNIGDLSNWNTGKVTDMSSMFAWAGYSVSSFNIGNIGKWDVSQVTSMISMFSTTAKEAKTFYIGDLSNWNTGNVTTMYTMFSGTAPNANWSQNLSKWNVNKVERYWEFSYGVEKKITSPKWVLQEPNYAV